MVLYLESTCNSDVCVEVATKELVLIRSAELGFDSILHSKTLPDTFLWLYSKKDPKRIIADLPSWISW